MIVIKKGIDLPIQGVVQDNTIHQANPTSEYAVLGDDYLGLKPTMFVAEGDSVQEGQVLFEDKKKPGVKICAPVAGKIKAIVRGERRKLISVIITADNANSGGFVSFKQYSQAEIEALDAQTIKDQLKESGCWSYFRTRPFDKIPQLDSKPHSIFVNTMDTNPLAIDPLLALANREADYQAGLSVLAKLTEGDIHICHKAKAELPQTNVSKAKKHEFGGIHPAGLVGTHIHFIDGVGANKTVWHISLQDLLAIGYLFLQGRTDNERIISVAGPAVKEPKFVKVRRGVNVSELLNGNLQEGRNRIISGSVFSGRATAENTDFLSAYDQQISVLPEGGDAVFLEFMRPGLATYSATRAYAGRFVRSKFKFNTLVQGSARAILPFGIYEQVMPLDILPTLLLKAISVKDTDTAVQLGALELVEEDLALLTYVDPGKHDFGAILRENLTQIEEEG
ncbi:MAG: Na(+)-translocating NADH-quinone reductase subunit A [Cardiobacteriaceae bacterium]|nr:Na(+)-translocating NADH-quinone reductase subunit A [Cardiobacteriaceae bacterium]